MMHRHVARRGISLIEVSAATILTGLVLSASLVSFAHATSQGRQVSNAAFSTQLATDLLNEIMAQAFDDPTTGSATYGLESGESGSNRMGFDDVDDYNGLIETTIKDRQGNVVPGSSGYTRTTLVLKANPIGLQGPANSVRSIYIGVNRTNQPGTVVWGFRSDVDDQDF